MISSIVSNPYLYFLGLYFWHHRKIGTRPWKVIFIFLNNWYPKNNFSLSLKEPCHAKLTFTRWKYTSNGNFFTFIIFFKAPPEGGQRSQQAFIWVLAGEAKIGDNRGFSGKLFFLCWMVMIFKCHISSISYARLWTKAEAEKPKIKVLCRRKCCFFVVPISP